MLETGGYAVAAVETFADGTLFGAADYLVADETDEGMRNFVYESFYFVTHF